MNGRDHYGAETFDRALAGLVMSGEMAVKLAGNPLEVLQLQLPCSR